MSVYDDKKFAWLSEEKDYVAEAVTAGKPYWGACMGTQLLAAGLGASVSRLPQPEIGFLGLT